MHEVLTMTDEIRQLIVQRAPDHSIRQAARLAGMRSMMEDGILKAAQGLTTLDEVVRVVAPDEPTVPAPASAQTPIQSEPGDALTANRAGPQGGLRVLIVEDSGTVATVVKYFLELEGFEVLEASDGREGLDIARREVPDVIVSDIQMPGMNGMELLKALRSDPGTSHIPVIMLTSDGSVESEAQGLALGADDYLAKPVEPRRLAARVKALVNRVRGMSAPSAV